MKIFLTLTDPNLAQAEDMVSGLGTKMFIIAGPVIVYGTVASIAYGIILYLFGLA